MPFNTSVAALKLSPNRFNALYNAGQAAERMGDATRARHYYAALLKSTESGSHTERAEFAHINGFLAAVTSHQSAL